MVRIAGYYFSNTGHCGEAYKSEIALRFATHTIARTMFISDGTQDQLDRLNSSHSARDFSMANNPSPVLAWQIAATYTRDGSRSATGAEVGGLLVLRQARIR